jgi:hypothetical protein
MAQDGVLGHDPRPEQETLDLLIVREGHRVVREDIFEIVVIAAQSHDPVFLLLLSVLGIRQQHDRIHRYPRNMLR